MRYMLLVCTEETDEESPAQTEHKSAAQKRGPACWVPWAEQLKGLGVVLLDGALLRPVATATTVRMRGSEALVADGPFAETKEQIAGYQVIECEDLDAAIQAASCHPAAQVATIEVRPIQEES